MSKFNYVSGPLLNRLSEISTVAPSDGSPSQSSPGDKETTRKERRNRQRNIRKKLEHGKRLLQIPEVVQVDVREASSQQFCIHAEDSDGWVSDESEGQEFVKKFSRDPEQSSQGDEDKEFQKWEQDMNFAADFGLIEIFHTGNDVHIDAKESHPKVVLAARAGDSQKVEEILNKFPEKVDARRKRTEIGSKQGHDKVWTWDDDTALISAARAGMPGMVKLLLARGANPRLESCAGVDDVYMKI